MTKKEATVGAVAEELCSAVTLPSTDAERFLRLLGKDPATTWFRTFARGKGSNRTRSGRDLHGFDAAALEADNQAGEAVYFRTGDANQATGKNKKTGKPTGCVTDADITRCTSVFVEWDNHPIEWQVQASQELGLPEPTAMVHTGGKSVHCYWRLAEPMAPDEWRVLQRRLIDYAGGDTACKNPSRLMRLPGFRYVDKGTGKLTDNVAELIYQTDVAYTAAEIEACIPAPQPAAAPAQLWTGELPPRSEADLLRALERVPEFFHDQGRRLELLGLAQRLTVEWGADRAHSWLAQHSPTVKDLAGYFTSEPNQIRPGWIWPFLHEHYGVDLKRHDLKRSRHTTPATPPAAQQQDKPAPKPKKDTKPRKLSHTKAMACFEKCVEIQAKRERNSLRRRARLMTIAKALGLAACINRQEIAQRVLEAKDEHQGHSFKALTAADRLAMKAPVVRWLIANLVPAGDLTIIGGRPKVGKTRLAVAIAAAVLKGHPFADFGCIKEPRPVLLITDDQADGDTHQMLQQLKVWDHPQLMWSRHFRLNDRDVDAMLETIKANPGALVVVDSLRSVSRSLPAGENDPEIGAYLYDLKAAVIEAGGSLIVIHHCNKAADLVGTEALSGHNAIAGAANTVITLHHCPDANGRPDKTNPQRRMFSEGRSGPGCDLVIDRQDGGTYRQVAGFDQWQRQLEEAKKQQKQSEGLTPTQQQLLELLEEQAGEAFTRRQLVVELGLDWGDGRGTDAKRVRESLNRLVHLELIDKERAGKEWTFTASHDGQKEPSPSSPSSPCSDTKAFQGDVQGDGDVSFVSFQSEQGFLVIGTDEPPISPPAKETKETTAAPQTSPSNRLQQQQGDEGDVPNRTCEKKSPPWAAAALAIHEQDPAAAAFTVALKLQTDHGFNVTGKQVKELLSELQVAA